MESEDLTLEDKCEHLMNIVVESRKRFGTMCIDYEQKTSMIENKMLNLQLETIPNYKFKSKQNLPEFDIESMTKDIADVNVEIVEWKNKVDELKKNIRNTQSIVLQLKKDQIGRRLHMPLTAEAMLASAKIKNCS